MDGRVPKRQRTEGPTPVGNVPFNRVPLSNLVSDPISAAAPEYHGQQRLLTPAEFFGQPIAPHYAAQQCQTPQYASAQFAPSYAPSNTAHQLCFSSVDYGNPAALNMYQAVNCLTREDLETFLLQESNKRPDLCLAFQQYWGSISPGMLTQSKDQHMKEQERVARAKDEKARAKEKQREEEEKKRQAYARRDAQIAEVIRVAEARKEEEKLQDEAKAQEDAARYKAIDEMRQKKAAEQAAQDKLNAEKRAAEMTMQQEVAREERVEQDRFTNIMKQTNVLQKQLNARLQFDLDAFGVPGCLAGLTFFLAEDVDNNGDKSTETWRSGELVIKKFGGVVVKKLD